MSGQGEEKAGGGGLRHVALFYRDQAEYRARILSFVQAGLTRGEPSFIAVPGDEARLLSDQLDARAGDLQCADMADLGRNPARIIPEQQAFIDRHPGQHVRFVGEPIWAGRSPAEICEATRHEALINLAFPRTRITILCPYDLARLAPSAIADARHTHPELLANGGRAVTPGNAAPWQVPPECDRPLPPPPITAEALSYSTDLTPVRRLVGSHAEGAGLGAERAADLVLAASEIAANTLCHARSDGLLQVWHDDQEILCQLHDRGWITDPLAGRVRRSPESRSHGLFLVNQMCDLVELRTGRAGTTIRLHVRLREAVGTAATQPPR
jgi:anti-sigma regulatory factor (Ser/Thr protein kinase)